jgi:hypothetical protein
MTPTKLFDEMRRAPTKTFSQLNDGDENFPTRRDERRRNFSRVGERDATKTTKLFTRRRAQLDDDDETFRRDAMSADENFFTTRRRAPTKTFHRVRRRTTKIFSRDAAESGGELT